MKIIIDTDPGFDDAMAMGVAFTWPDTEVLAITCVNGNVSVDQACINALKLRKVFGMENIPVHKGASKPLLAREHYNSSHWHGIDGLLDCTDIKIDQNSLSKQHSANCIIDIATKNKGEVSLVAMGPLTNLALAIRLCPELPSLLKEVIILGGNHTGLGNHTATAEYNFVADPVAAYIVLKDYTCPFYVVPWETVIEVPFIEQFNTEYCNKDNERSRFFKNIIEKHLKKHDLKVFDSADCLAMCVALNRENVVVEKMDVYGTVEPFGEHTHGMMVVDKRLNRIKNKANITLITKVNMTCIEEMLIHSVS